MKHAPETRKPYSGLNRSLVIAIDIGTTFSGVSYAILEPGEIPKIFGVTRFPGQEHEAGNSKIPSLIYYDRDGNVMAAGAEAESDTLLEEEGWIKTELFKLRLRPRTMQLKMNGMRLTPLPRRKSPVHVFGDYLAYLYRCTRAFITDTHANGASLWKSVESDIEFVLSHPNGWEGPQQKKMRDAAVYGKLIPDTDAGKARIRFVTEGEASLHACVLNGLAADVLSNPSKHGFLIVDAGGGTLDISAYAIKGTSPLAIEEIAPPDCIFAGSVFVSRRAREFLELKLKYSKYGTPEGLDHITRKFDEITKRRFRDRKEDQFIPFGSPLDKDVAVGIRAGQLKLSGPEVANLFEPSVDAAVNAIKKQIEASKGMIRSVFLVGGYAASPWLFAQLQERLSPLQITVSRPDTQTSKAVADGAVGFYCDHHVSARMSKFMYGVEFLRALDPNDPDHVARKEKLCELPSGPRLLPDAFDCILARGAKVKESTVFTRKYSTELTNLSMLPSFEVEIWCYRGGNVVPKWINKHDADFSTLCVVQADLSLLNGSAEPKVGKNGKKYWTIIFSVEIHFGLTEFKARIKWMDNGEVKYGPAVIVYNEHGHRLEEDDDPEINAYPDDDGSMQNGSRSADRHRSDLPSLPHSPVDYSYPPSNSSMRAGVIPQVTHAVERAPSKGYPPSIAPSARSAAYSTRNDEEKWKGKGKETDSYKDPYQYPADNEGPRSSIHGPSPSLSRAVSNSGAVGSGGEMFSSGWGANPSVGVVPPSRPASIYGPGSGVGNEQRQSSAFGEPLPISSSTLDNFSDAPPASANIQRSPSQYDRPKSPMHHTDETDHHTPFIQAPSASPFGDRPRSGIVSFEKPSKSAFGDAAPIFGNEPPPPIFGDSGPAADAGASAFGAHDSLFGNPSPAFGGGETDSWGIPKASSAAESTFSKKSGKLKGKNSAAANSTPASGLASRASPSIGSNKSPHLTADFVVADQPIVAAVASTPSAPSGDALGSTSKAPSGDGMVSFENPSKSAFGDAAPIFGNEPPPPIFGDSGPAADAGASAFGAHDSLFGNPSPAFGGGETDSWGIPKASSAAESTFSKKSGKLKGKNSAAANSTPASGLTSRASPSIGSNKSPNYLTADFVVADQPVVAAVASTPSAPSGDVLGSISKAPSGDGMVSFENPSKSAFGDAAPTFGNDATPPIFGDSGPAADVGASASGAQNSLFGNPSPASAFGGANDSWGIPKASSAAESTFSTKSGKSKRKNSVAANSTPASGLVSRASPSIGSNKSPLDHLTADFVVADQMPVVAAVSYTPSAPSGDALGPSSKAPSPFKEQKRLSPLNPASQIGNEPDAFENETTTKVDDYGWENNDNHDATTKVGDSSWGPTSNTADEFYNSTAKDGNFSWGDNAANSGGDTWNNTDHVAISADFAVSQTATPIEVTPEFTEPLSGKKKKKKGSASVTPSKSPSVFDIGTAGAVETNESDPIASAKVDELLKVDDNQIQESKADPADDSKGSGPVFGLSGDQQSSSTLNPPGQPWVSADKAGGDDSWGTGGGIDWGSVPTKAKSKKGTTPVTETKPSLFGGDGWVFGSASGEQQASSNSFSFDESAPNLTLGGFDKTPISPAAEPAAEPIDSAPEATAVEAIAAGESGGGTGEGEGAENDAVVAGNDNSNWDAATTSGKKKKKNKKGDNKDTGGGGTDTPVETPGDTPVDTPTVEAQAPFEQSSKKKKKKK